MIDAPTYGFWKLPRSWRFWKMCDGGFQQWGLKDLKPIFALLLSSLGDVKFCPRLPLPCRKTQSLGLRHHSSYELTSIHVAQTDTAVYQYAYSFGCDGGKLCIWWVLLNCHISCWVATQIVCRFLLFVRHPAFKKTALLECSPYIQSVLTPLSV